MLTWNQGAEKVTAYQKNVEEAVHVTDISWRCESEIVILNSFGDFTKIFSYFRIFLNSSKVNTSKKCKCLKSSACWICHMLEKQESAFCHIVFLDCNKDWCLLWNSILSVCTDQGDRVWFVWSKSWIWDENCTLPPAWLHQNEERTLWDISEQYILSFSQSSMPY